MLQPVPIVPREAAALLRWERIKFKKYAHYSLDLGTSLAEKGLVEVIGYSRGGSESEINFGDTLPHGMIFSRLTVMDSTGKYYSDVHMVCCLSSLGKKLIEQHRDTLILLLAPNRKLDSILKI